MFDKKFVHSLGSGDFNKSCNIKKDGLKSGFTTVMVYATWCGHCMNAKPIYNALAKSTCCQTHCSAIDSDENKELLEKFNDNGISVEGFPTFLQFKDGVFYRSYDDSYTDKTALRNFIMGL